MKISLLGHSSYPHGDTSSQSSCKAVSASLAPSNPSGLRNDRWESKGRGTCRDAKSGRRIFLTFAEFSEIADYISRNRFVLFRWHSFCV
jgi:hypothetical protein